LNHKSPMVTVMMPVYNGMTYLSEAIESILNQTFTDFEFLIIDDASTDNSTDIIKGYGDNRIRLIENSKNFGQAKSMNKGLSLARGKYIARMDQDDVSASKRLDKQTKILDHSPQLGLVSTNCYLIDGTGEVYGRLNDNLMLGQTLSGGQVEWNLFWGNPIVHPSVMFRTKLVRNLSGYAENYTYHVEDYILWLRLLKKARIVILGEPLFYLRKHDLNATLVNFEPHIKEVVHATQKILSFRLGYEPSLESLRFLMDLSHGDRLSFKNTIKSLNILIDAYKYLVRKYQLDKNELYNIEKDFVSRFSRLIKLNVPYGRQLVAMFVGYLLFLFPLNMLNRFDRVAMLKLIFTTRFHYRDS